MFVADTEQGLPPVAGGELPNVRVAKGAIVSRKHNNVFTIFRREVLENVPVGVDELLCKSGSH